MQQNQALLLDTRNRIYTQVRRNPGLHFREIQRRVGIATGALQYHLDYLEKSHLLKSEKVKNTRHYFVVKEKETMDAEQRIMPLLRQNSVRHILITILMKRKATIQKISKATGLPYSTVSRHLEKLVEFNIVQRKRRGKTLVFWAEEAEQIAKMLSTYKRGFFDNAVDEFVEVWQEMHS